MNGTPGDDRKKPRELVLGTALGYSYKHVAPFAASLRQTGYAGEVVLFVGDLDPLSRRLLARKGITLIPADDPGLFQACLAAFPGADGAALRRTHIQTRRYIAYFGFLATRAGEFSEVLLTDVRDVFFQAPPFAFTHEVDSLSHAVEERTIGPCQLNSEWILDAFDQATVDRLAPLEVSCSGTTIGSERCIRDYLTRMVEFIVENPVPTQGVDQGIHNVIIHDRLVSPLNPCPNQDGPFLSLEGGRAWSISDSGEVLLGNGTVAPIVHQYDRHPELEALVQRRYLPGWLLSSRLRKARRAHLRRKR